MPKSNPLMYDMILRKGWPAHKVVIGLVTNPENGHGWVPWETLANLLPLLASRRPDFGGVCGWEYFNSLPGGHQRPWEWAEWMAALLGADRAAAASSSVGEKGPEVGPGAPRQDAAAESWAKAGIREGTKPPLELDPDNLAGHQAPVPQAFEYDSDGLFGEEES